jgi:four helix bundle protein
MEKSRDLRERSFQFAVAVTGFYRTAQSDDAAVRRLANQLLDAAGSIGANLEEAAAGQSKADFIAKNCIAPKEAREARYWLRLIAACPGPLMLRVAELIAESSEIIAMLTASIKTARRNAAANRGSR